MDGSGWLRIPGGISWNPQSMPEKRNLGYGQFGLGKTGATAPCALAG